MNRPKYRLEPNAVGVGVVPNFDSIEDELASKKFTHTYGDDYRKTEYKVAERVADFYTALITEGKLDPDVALALTQQYFAALLEQGVGQ